MCVCIYICTYVYTHNVCVYTCTFLVTYLCICLFIYSFSPLFVYTKRDTMRVCFDRGLGHLRVHEMQATERRCRTTLIQWKAWMRRDTNQKATMRSQKQKHQRQKTSKPNRTEKLSLSLPGYVYTPLYCKGSARSAVWLWCVVFRAYGLRLWVGVWGFKFCTGRS